MKTKSKSTVAFGATASAHSVPNAGGILNSKFVLKCIAAFALASFVKVHAAQADDWLCKEESSQLVESVLQACGIGDGKDENEARAKAFEHARDEFLRVCAASDTCKDKQVSVEPKRTSCESISNRTRCYRLVAFSISGETSAARKTSDRSSYKKDLATASNTKGLRRPTVVAIHDRNETFTPFNYESIEQLPKVRRGQSKAELLAAFGAPQSVSEMGYGSSKYHIFYFKGEMCLYASSFCNVSLIHGKVADYDSFKPIYTEDLK